MYGENRFCVGIQLESFWLSSIVNLKTYLQDDRSKHRPTIAIKKNSSDI